MDREPCDAESHAAVDTDARPLARGWFATTHWTVVTAAKQAEAPEQRQALESLCADYWRPLYCCVRQKGYSPEDAEDLTQAFFETFLEKDYLSQVEREKGRFRTFLQVALHHFLANQWNKSKTQKRGGRFHFLSYDFEDAETRFGLASSDFESPEQMFDRQSAQILLARALDRLEEAYATLGKQQEYELLQPFLTRQGSGEAYSAVSAQLGRNRVRSPWRCYEKRDSFAMELGFQRFLPG